MPVKLYYNLACPAVRAVLITLKTLSVPYELVDVNLLEYEHLSEEYQKLNPQHTVPVIRDEDEFVIWDSHAINAYLASKYGSNDSLYPKDLKARAIVDQRLHFNNGVLLPSLRNVVEKIFEEKILTKINEDQINLIEKAYAFLEKFLLGNQYAAGNEMTIADFSILTTLSNLSVFVPLSSEKYPSVVQYVQRGQANIPNFKELEEWGKQRCIEILESFNYKF